MEVLSMITNKCEFIPSIQPNFENVDLSSMLIIQMQTTGHYWRNSQITEIGLLSLKKDNIWDEEHLVSEVESDEYDMLVLLSKKLSEYEYMIGYNSTSFLLPYLEQKYRAYGLEYPFIGKQHTDLYLKYKNYGKNMRLSMKLEELKYFLCLPEDYNELETILCVTWLERFSQFFFGEFEVDDVQELGEELLITMQTPITFPCPYRYHHPAFYLICEKNQAKIKIKLFENRLRMYYSNYQDYYYLPAEDTVIHKSMASAVDKSQRIKADETNCYTYTAYTPAFRQNKKMIKKYILSLLNNCSC